MVNLGTFLISIPLSISLIQAIKSFLKNDKITVSQTDLTKICFAFVLVSFLFLIYKFAISDFSYSLVFFNSHTLKPLLYKITGAWGNHEGSMLLFILILAGYNFFYATYSKFEFKEQVLGFQSVILFLIIFYTYFTSNPFEPLAEDFGVVKEGMGLNPLLQDIGLAIHPPILYLGYAGFSIAFSHALVILKYRQTEKKFIEFLRPWILFSWSMLTIGVGLGSWWAYRELGWGGFWFWDPVESISIVPWLFGCALIHGIYCVKKFNKFAFPTLFLCLITFLSALLGFFLVRSGVLSSVHTFADDPTRGYVMLGIIALISSYAMIILGKNFIEMEFKTEGQTYFISREIGILLQMILLFAMASTILLGIIYPIILEIFIDRRISVGEPYFNSVFIPIALGFIILMVFAPILKWQREKLGTVIRKSLFSFVISLGLAGLLCVKYPQNVSLFLAFSIFACGWLFISAVEIILRRLLKKEKISKSFASMIISHGAFGLLGLSIALVVTFESDTQLLFKEGDSKTFAGYDFKLKSSDISKSSNYLAQRADFQISKGNSSAIELSPENRIYFPGAVKTHEAQIDYGILKDIYVVMGQTETKKDKYLFPTRIYIKPFIFFIWFSVLCMAFGGFLALLPKKK